jgi:2'-5' RNA ligase
MPGRDSRSDRAHDAGRDARPAALRLFFALLPDEAARTALATAAGEVARGTGGRAPRAENLHMTIAFLGDLPVERLAELRAIGTAVAAPASPFELALTKLGFFRDAGIAWFGAQPMPEELHKLVESLRGELRAHALPVERRAFQPHVTLARRCTKPWTGGTFAPVAWRVDALALMASETLPEGARYRALDAWPLAAAPTLA